MSEGTRDEVIGIVTRTLRRTYSDSNLEGDVAIDTRLAGKSALLDSLQLVSFIVDVESEVNAAFGSGIALADEKAMSREKSPFRSVETLVEYVTELLAE